MHYFLVLNIFLANLALVLAKPAGSFNVTVTFAEANGCDHTCQKILDQTNAFDRTEVGDDFDFDFYATAGNFTGSKPGDLLKLQALDPSTLNVRAGTTVFRLQYTSLDLDGETLVPATGFIAFPYTPLGHSKTYHTVAFAHGTIGLYPGCAPSNGPTLYDYDSWQLLTERGYAVVATDYAGLGNNHTSHKYCSFPAHVNDVYYSIIAAQRAFGSVLSREWMGSLVVRNDVRHPYLGTVALAPATHIVDMFYDGLVTMATRNGTDGLSVVGYTPYLALAYQRVYTSYNLTILGPRLRQRMNMANEAQLCTTAFMGLTLDLDDEQLISTEGVKNDRPLFDEWQREVSPTSGGRTPAPVLVLQGLNDTTIMPDATKQAYQRSCKAEGNEVHLSLYPGADHVPLVAAAAPEWLAWMDARFAGLPTPGRCSSEVRRPFNDGANIKLPPDFDLSDLE
ncbi:hypothetical protein PT974_01304 [Cladobotryum mycophilum]|uniref:Uncharacterized protein n=1 Tax=Cladobotryum mycophilum TaxID=491253 RepID=A0ABR0T3A6_9HYPO